MELSYDLTTGASNSKAHRINILRHFIFLNIVYTLVTMDIAHTRLFDFISYQLENHPLDSCLATKRDGKWISYSTSQVIDMSYDLSHGLLELGVSEGDKVAIISTTNRPEWNIVDLATLQIGAIDVPIYPTITIEDYKYIFKDCGAKIAFVSDKDLYEKLVEVQKEIPQLEKIFIFDEEAGMTNWKTVLDKGKGKPKEAIDVLKERVNSEDLATLIYTSGTTGNPKGVMLSHKNIVSNVLASAVRLPCKKNSIALSFLPLCHIFERMLIYMYAYKCVNVHYAESMETIGDNMKEIKPDVFTAVPRLLEKVYDKIVAKGSELTGIKKSLFFWAVSLGEVYEPYGRNGAWYEFKLKIARKVIFSKWQEALGGNVKIAACGSAALSPRLARIFNAAGIPIMEGYGLTETSPVISVNEIGNDGFRFGTTGRPIDHVEVKIAEDGEILCKGPNLMMGYYNQPEMTAKVIDEDGWFHTGDIGILEEGQYLKITDRKKEMFKTSGGKYVAPQLIENSFKQSRFIEQIMVVGNNRKHPAALIVPNFEFLKEYCTKQNIEFTDNKSLCESPRVIERIMQEVNNANSEFAKWEQIKKIKLIAEEFTIDGGELTPTMKLKRKVVAKKYSSLIEAIYA